MSEQKTKIKLFLSFEVSQLSLKVTELSFKVTELSVRSRRDKGLRADPSHSALADAVFGSATALNPRPRKRGPKRRFAP
jgi:hypothetical protein